MGVLGCPRSDPDRHGRPTLLQLFASSEIGGSSKPETLAETGETYDAQDVLVPNAANVAAKVHQLLDG